MNTENSAESAPEELGRIQRWLQAVITHPDGVEAGAASAEAMQLIHAGPQDLQKVVTASRNLSASERLAIYGHAYYARLVECLSEIYPVLRSAVGEETFSGFAFGYLQRYPSRSYTLNNLGRLFSSYLDETRPTAGPGDEDGNWPQFLVDLARLEWGIYEVFDGPGIEEIPLLSADTLLEIPVTLWGRVTLTPAPCLRLLKTDYPVNGYFTARVRETGDSPIPWSRPELSYTALMRRDYVVRRYTLTEEEYGLLGSLVAGDCLEAAIERLAMDSGMELEKLAQQLSVWLRNWTAEGFFVGVSSEGVSP